MRTRPTQARLRQALFNSLQGVLPESRCLDLFAGSGALGFEALSRGASFVVFVERARPVCRLIRENAHDLGVEDRIQILEDSAESFWPRVQSLAPFQIVLADPPYDAGFEEKLLHQLPWDRLLESGGYFCLEWSPSKSQVNELPERVPHLVKVREKNYGDSVLTTYQRET